MSISSTGTYSLQGIPPQITTPQSENADVAAKNRAISSVTRFLNDTKAAGDSHEFSIAIDPTTRQAVVRIVDLATRQVLEQVPTEYLLQVAQQLSETLAKQSLSTADKTLTT